MLMLMVLVLLLSISILQLEGHLQILDQPKRSGWACPLVTTLNRYGFAPLQRDHFRQLSHPLFDLQGETRANSLFCKDCLCSTHVGVHE